MAINRGVKTGLRRDPYANIVEAVYPITASGTKRVLPDPAKWPMTRMKLTANCGIVMPTPVVGLRFTLALAQDDVGNRLAVFDSTVSWVRNIPPTLSTAPRQVDYLDFACTTEGVWDGFTTGLGDFGQITMFSLGDGDLAVGTFNQRFRTFVQTIEILGVAVTTGFGFGPTGSSAIFDLVTGDTATTLWGSNPGSRPTILAGNQECLAETVPDTTTVSGGTSIRARCVQVGSTLPGSYAVLNMRWRWAP